MQTTDAARSPAAQPTRPPGSTPRRSPSRYHLGVLLAACLALAAAADARPAGTPEATAPVAATEHFAFHSDFETNLHDALVISGKERSRDRGELFREGGEEADCFAELPALERAGWDHAVDFYAEAVSGQEQVDPPRNVPRLLLAGIATEADLDDGERRLGRVVAGMRQAAAAAYRACRWPRQDSANREWIDALLRLLEDHESALAPRLSEVFQRPWEGLPLRVDVVDYADWSGAHTINLRPPDGAHVQVSSSHPGYRGPAALEMVFHEAGHFLTGRETPLRQAVQRALEEHRFRFRGDLVHHVHFWLVGEEVRRRLATAGVDYEPFMYAAGHYEGGSFAGAAERAWPPYLDGETDLRTAADQLVAALAQGVRDASP